MMLTFAFFLIVLLINKIYTYQNVLTVIGNKNVTNRSGIITQSVSKLSINGPFYCYIKWIDNKQTIDIFTDDNIHSYIIVKFEKDTILKIMIQSDVNLKITQMDIYLNLHSTIKEIFLAGISTLDSENILKSNNILKLRVEDTCSLNLPINVLNLDALFLSAGTTKLIGDVKNIARINYYGIGDVDASELFCKIVDINANGLGTVWITSTNICLIKAIGMSIVKYKCPHINHTELADLAKIIPI